MRTSADADTISSPTPLPPSSLPSSFSLQVSNLAKQFVLHQRGSTVLRVLQDFSMTVGQAECVALAGASGRGKSTIIKCLYGNYGVDSGQILLSSGEQGVDLATASPQTVLRLRRTTIGHVSQFLRVVPRISALDVVAQPLLEGLPPMDDSAYDDQVREARERAASLLARLQLPRSIWPLPPATFSGGEQQRVNIARGFVRWLPLMLLDEPTASLDAANRRIVIDLIREARTQGSAIVGIFHDQEVRDALADRLVEV